MAHAGTLPVLIDTSEVGQRDCATFGAIQLGDPYVVAVVRTSHHAGLADDALVAGLAIEDPDAATVFVRRFQAKVFGMALSVTHDPTMASDVAQDAFLRAWRSASTYDGLRGSVSAWLLTITRNAAIDAVRARRPLPAGADVMDRLLQATLGQTESMDVTGDAAATSVEAGLALHRLRQLPPEQARAVVMAVFGGCTAREISVRDGIPLGTAKTRIRSGLRRLRQERAGPLDTMADRTPRGSWETGDSGE